MQYRTSKERLFVIDSGHDAQRIRGIVGRTADIAKRSTPELVESTTEALNVVEYGVEAAATAMELEHFSIFVVTGEQGGGKDTNIKALKEASLKFKALGLIDVSPELQSVVDAFGGNMGEIVTGTKGIFNKPEGEYLEMFERANEVTAQFPPAKGVMVPDAITSTFTELMIQRRIFQGYDSVITNVWPRSDGQQRHAERLLGRLSSDVKCEGGVQFDARMDMIDIKIMDKETVARVDANREEYALKAETLGNEFKNWAKANSEELSGLEPGGQLKRINEMLITRREQCEGDQATIDLLDEASLSFGRVAARLAESAAGDGRTDDKDIVAVLTRIASYLNSTAPGTLRNKNVKLIASKQSPEDVVTDFVLALVGDVNMSANGVKEFVELARSEAHRLVFKD